MKRTKRLSLSLGLLLAVGLFTTIAVFSLQILFSPLEAGHEVHTARDFFASEDEFRQYILNEVSFDDISFQEVSIERGDNFWLLARRHNINIDTLIAANPWWTELLARINQKVLVPSRPGTLHIVDSKADVRVIAALYEIPEDKIIVQKLPPFFSFYSRFKKDNKPVAIFIPDTKPSTRIMTPELASQFKVREMFRSPLGGRFSSFFGSRTSPIFQTAEFHNGIDIASSYGTYVGASADGVVQSCGWMGGYGLAVIIVHKDGYKTLYGHMSAINVHSGQKVQSGNLIGRVGSTGWSTGPHLHFTLWKNGVLLNPMDVLW